jgi:hypothetical protein
MKQEYTSTHIQTIKFSTLNIKYYNFGSSFDTTEFCNGNYMYMQKRYTRRYKGDTLSKDVTLKSGQRLQGLQVWSNH